MGRYDKFLGDFRDFDLTKIQQDKLKQVMPGFLGCFPTVDQLRAKHPTGENGQYAFVNTTGTYWDWDTVTNDWIDTGSAISSYTKAEVDALLLLKQAVADRRSAWQSTPDDSHYPSEKLVKDSLDLKQNTATLATDVADAGFLRGSATGSEKKIWTEKGSLLELFGSDSKILAAFLPSFVDDVIEVNQYEDLPQPGENGKIYVILSGAKANRCYRWGGTVYVEISPSLVIGEVAGTAFDGARGKAVEEGLSGHAARTDNPHAVTKAQVGLGDVDNTSDMAKPVSTPQQTALDLKQDKADRVTGWQSTPDDLHYPSEKLVKDTLDLKQNVSDSSLATTAKTVPGAINELHEGKVGKSEVPVRANSTAYTSDMRVSYPGKYGYMLKCTTGGTSGSSLPAWPTSVTSGSTTLTDGSVVWTIFDFTAVSDVSGKVDRTELPVRANSHAYDVGARVLYPEKYSWVLVCKTAGSSGASLPAWPASVESGITELGDGTATWRIYDLLGGEGHLIQKEVFPAYSASLKVFQYTGTQTAYRFGAIYIENSSATGYELLHQPMTEIEAIGFTGTEDRTIAADVLGYAIDEKFHANLKMRKSATAYLAGDRVTYPGKTGYVLVCRTGGTSGASLPSWPASVVSEETTITDGGAVWVVTDLCASLRKKDAALREFSKAYALGDRVLYPGKHSWSLVCTTAGTSGAVLPVWPTSIISGTTALADGTAVWTIYDMAKSGSTVSVAATGTSTDEVSYITIDGTEKKLAGTDGVPRVTTMPPSSTEKTVLYDGLTAGGYTHGQHYSFYANGAWAIHYTIGGPGQLSYTHEPLQESVRTRLYPTDTSTVPMNRWVTTTKVYDSATGGSQIGTVLEVTAPTEFGWKQSYAGYDDAVPRVTSMPPASSMNQKTVVYDGTTTTDYTKGRLYQYDGYTHYKIEWLEQGIYEQTHYTVAQPQAGGYQQMYADPECTQLVLYLTDGVMVYQDGETIASVNSVSPVQSTHWAPVYPDTSACLPLSGGTMTGVIQRSGNDKFAARDVDTSYLSLYGGTGWQTGAALHLLGKDFGSTPGAFKLFASNGTTDKTLMGTTAGALTWDGKAVITASGGTMTGTLFTSHPGIIRGDGTVQYVEVTSGTSWADSGAGLSMVHGNATSNTGQFFLRAKDTTKECYLDGRPDGQLYWGGKSVARGLQIKEYTLSCTVTNLPDNGDQQYNPAATIGANELAVSLQSSGGIFGVIPVCAMFSQNGTGINTYLWLLNKSGMTASGTFNFVLRTLVIA